MSIICLSKTFLPDISYSCLNSPITSSCHPSPFLFTFFKDCSYIRYNVSPKKKIATESQRKAVSQYMNLDTELLAIANDYLDATLDRLYLNLNERQQYLNDFRKRCHLKERKNRVLNAAKSIERTAKRAIMKTISSRNE